MRRLAAGMSVTGLALMTSVGLLLCRPGLSLETRIALFLSGVALFVAGGVGYSAAAAPVAGDPVRK